MDRHLPLACPEGRTGWRNFTSALACFRSAFVEFVECRGKFPYKVWCMMTENDIARDIFKTGFYHAEHGSF